MRTTGIKGEMPNQAKKQKKKASQERWKARICGVFARNRSIRTALLVVSKTSSFRGDRRGTRVLTANHGNCHARSRTETKPAFNSILGDRYMSPMCSATEIDKNVAVTMMSMLTMKSLDA